MAEFQSRSGSAVRLITEPGQKLDVPFDRLSRIDRDYIELHSPPGLSVEVDPHINHVSDSVLQRAGEGYLVLDFTVGVRKKGLVDYSLPLQLNLYVVGVQEVTGDYIILQHVCSELVFATGESRKNIKAGQVLLRLTAEDVLSEAAYNGYLLVITDQRGNPIVVQSNRKAFERNTDLFNGGKKGMTFSSQDLEGD